MSSLLGGWVAPGFPKCGTTRGAGGWVCLLPPRPSAPHVPDELFAPASEFPEVLSASGLKKKTKHHVINRRSFQSKHEATRAGR